MEISLLLLAQGTASLLQYLPLVAILFLAYFLLFLPQRRKEQEHRNLLSNLKKDDRIVTIGGIYGVVANVRRESDRVTIKVDEANNTKIDITFAAVSRIIVDAPVGEKSTK